MQVRGVVLRDDTCVPRGGRRDQREDDGDLAHERLAEREMTLTLTDAARDRLAEAGFDPVYGARPLKRAIQQQIENPLANEILEGKFGPGDSIEIGVDDDGLQFQNAA